VKLAAALLSIPLLAQTTIKPEQLRTTAPDAPKPVLLAYTLRGFQSVTLGPGITATQTATGWTIDVTPATVKFKLVRTQTQLTPAADGSYPLSETGVLKRNGLSQTAGVDYTYTNGRATPKTPWAADDVVVADEITLVFQ
jgi:hypothetical protein